MRLDELSFEIRLERRTTKDSLSGRIMPLVPVLTLETLNQTNYKMFAQVRPHRQCVLSIKTANGCALKISGFISPGGKSKTDVILFNSTDFELALVKLSPKHFSGTRLRQHFQH